MNLQPFSKTLAQRNTGGKLEHSLLSHLRIPPSVSYLWHVDLQAAVSHKFSSSRKLEDYMEVSVIKWVLGIFLGGPLVSKIIIWNFEMK